MAAFIGSGGEEVGLFFWCWCGRCEKGRRAMGMRGRNFMIDSNEEVFGEFDDDVSG